VSGQGPAVLGAGSWGTAIACVLARLHDDVVLWARDAGAASRLQTDRENEKYLPGVTLPASLTVTADLSRAAACPNLVVAVPTGAQREVARAIAPHGPERVLCAAKGYEPETRARMSELLVEELGGTGVAVLAGPSHAEEVGRGAPTTVVVASEDESVAIAFQELLHAPTFRVYTNTDLLGVETAASLKNVIAIAAGISAGLGLGDNTMGALLTRGLAEISRLGEALGARPETFFGLAGIGDLVTTCISRHSRNRKVGELVAQGQSLDEALEETRMVAEGVITTRSVLSIAGEHGVELPISEQVARVLFAGKDARTAIGDLMGRDAKAEVS
jgi:glycerol-3-phosphate dehydrogenase (NAD(P)+)